MSGRTAQLGGHRLRRTIQTGLPVALLVALIVAMLALPLYSDTSASTFNVYNMLQSFASLGLLALAVGLTIVAGEFDLATLGMYALGAMLAVTLGGDQPLLGLAAAVGVGVVVGLIQGGVITRFEISSVPVTLGSYIALIGLTNVISDGDSIAYENFAVGLWLDEPVATFFSPRSLIAIAIILAAAALLKWSRLGRDVRALGGDRRAARAAGVRTGRVLVGVFVASASLSALAGALLAYSVATATPDPGVSPLIFAVTAVLIGGVSLAGGQGGPLAIALGAIVLALLQQLFTILATPNYVAELVQGGLLIVVVAIDAPDLRRRLIVLRSRLGEHREAPAHVP